MPADADECRGNGAKSAYHEGPPSQIVLAVERGPLAFDLRINDSDLIRKAGRFAPRELALLIQQAIAHILDGRGPAYEHPDIGVLRVHSSLVRECHVRGIAAEAVAAAVEVALQKLLARHQGGEAYNWQIETLRAPADTHAAAVRATRARDELPPPAILGPTIDCQDYTESHYPRIVHMRANVITHSSVADDEEAPVVTTPTDASPRDRLLAAIGERVERARESGRTVDTVEVGRREFALLDLRPGMQLIAHGVALAVVVAGVEDGLSVYRAPA